MTSASKGFAISILYVIIAIFIVALIITFFFLQNTGYLERIAYMIGIRFSPP